MQKTEKKDAESALPRRMGLASGAKIDYNVSMKITNGKGMLCGK